MTRSVDALDTTLPRFVLCTPYGIRPKTGTVEKGDGEKERTSQKTTRTWRGDGDEAPVDAYFSSPKLPYSKGP